MKYKPIRFTVNVSEKGVYTYAPVSYTHLDVYKRQTLLHTHARARKKYTILLRHKLYQIKQGPIISVQY